MQQGLIAYSSTCAGTPVSVFDEAGSDYAQKDRERVGPHVLLWMCVVGPDWHQSRIRHWGTCLSCACRFCPLALICKSPLALVGMRFYPLTAHHYLCLSIIINLSAHSNLASVGFPKFTEFWSAHGDRVNALANLTIQKFIPANWKDFIPLHHDWR